MSFFDIDPLLVDDILLLLPVGLLGVWRWSMWLVKRFLSSRWKDVEPSERTKDWKVGVALTVKGEPPDTFAQVLERLVSEKIEQACIVFDYREEENMRRTAEFAEAHKHLIDIRSKSTDKKGKRSGLQQAIAMCEGMDIIMCMDSDTLLGAGVKESVKAAFSDPKVGGSAVGQRCYQPDNWVQHLFDMRLVERYHQDIPGQAYGGRITCLSGRCSAYLAGPLQEIAPGLLTEEWAGIKKTGGGDDKYLTTAIHDLGYLTIAVRNAWVYTRSEPSVKIYVSQSLRWARNSWFSDFRALFTRWWMRKTPILLFYTLDRMVSSFTIVLGIAFMIFTLWHQQWLVALVLLIWWHLSRIIKAWPFFWETKRFYMIVPYTFMTFYIGILKVHALITLHEGSWLTRGATSQAKLRKRLMNLGSQLATSSIVGFAIFLVFFVLNDIPIPPAPDPDDPAYNYITVDPYALSLDGLVVDNDEVTYFLFPAASVMVGDFENRSENGSRIRQLRENVLSFTPRHNFEGEDTFEFTLIYKGSELVTTGTINVTVESLDDQQDEIEVQSTQATQAGG